MKIFLNKLKIWTASLLVILGLIITLVPMQTYAVGDASKATVCDSIGAANCSSGGASIGNIVKVIINIVSFIIGIVAVLMVIVGGFKYVTSAGESSKIASAKNTIIYAIVGLVIVALSQFLVQFVLSKATSGQSSNSTPTNSIPPINCVKQKNACAQPK
jgi:hypothetical protein